jgi:hypothetical protein
MRYLFSIFSILIASSCANDFDVVIPAKPTTFVYCVLSTTDSVHYIRINKSFVVFDNALDYVKYSDSLYYPDLDLSLALTHKNSQVVTIIPVKGIFYSKDTGLFAQDPNILYAFHFDLKEYASAKLRLIIPQNADTITAETSIVDTGKFLLPGKWSSNKSISFFGDGFSLRWGTGSGSFHSMRYTFHYHDILENGTIPRSFEYRFQSDLNVQGEREFCLKLEDFLYTVKSRIPNRPEVEVRIFDSIDFHIESAEKFLYEYGNLFRTNPSEYALINFTNIKNGSGILSSKSIIHHTGMTLDIQALKALINSDITKHLRFVSY